MEKGLMEISQIFKMHRYKPTISVKNYEWVILIMIIKNIIQ